MLKDAENERGGRNDAQAQLEADVNESAMPLLAHLHSKLSEELRKVLYDTGPEQT